LLFTLEVTIPALTTETDPSIETLKLSAGVITSISIKFPAGCHGLVGVRLFHEESQIIPIGRGSWVRGDDETVPSTEYYDLGKGAKELEFVGINEDDTYSHTVIVRVNVLPKEAASLMPLISFIEKLTRRIFGE
jgi:hypothetical protein